MIYVPCHKQCVKVILCSHLYCTSALISNHIFYSPHKYILNAFFSFLLHGRKKNKRQNSVERQQVIWLSGAQLAVCLLHNLLHNYPLSTCLNRRSGFTCFAPQLELEIEIHGKAIQVASAEHPDQTAKKSVYANVLRRGFTVDIVPYKHWVSWLHNRAQPINGLL